MFYLDARIFSYEQIKMMAYSVNMHALGIRLIAANKKSVGRMLLIVEAQQQIWPEVDVAVCVQQYTGKTEQKLGPLGIETQVLLDLCSREEPLG